MTIPLHRHWLVHPPNWMDKKYQVYDSPYGQWIWQYDSLVAAYDEAVRVGGIIYEVAAVEVSQ